MPNTLAHFARRYQAVRRRLATTPGRLTLGMVLVWVLPLAFFLAVFLAVAVHYQGMKTIGKDAAPSIIAAQDIKTSLAEMHSLAAQLFLAPGGDPKAANLYEVRRKQATKGLIAAAENITYDDEERIPIRNLLDALGIYEADIAQAQVLHTLKGPKDAEFLRRFRDADAVLHQGPLPKGRQPEAGSPGATIPAPLTTAGLLPTAHELDVANRKPLDDRYTRQSSLSWWTVVGVVLTGGALTALLVVLQFFLYRRTRRRLNAGLLAATALTAVFLIVSLTALFRESAYLRLAKQDAFESIHALWQARADAYDANGALRRALLDPEHARDHQKEFSTLAEKLIQLPQGMTPAGALSTAQQRKPPDAVKGYLADELRNITFQGEKEAALLTLDLFFRYLESVKQVHDLADKNRLEEARVLALGTKRGETMGAFAAFDDALGQTLKINQDEFERAVSSGFNVLSGLEVWAAIVAVGVAVLASLGLRPRLREYMF